MLEETGALISLQPNASKLVTRWGLDPFLHSAEPLIDRGFRVFDMSGKLVNELKLKTARFGADRVLYHRQDLHSALRDAATSTQLAGEPVEIRTTCPVKSCDPEGGVVTLESGEQIQADLVIGADGIKSVIRTAVLGEHCPAIPTGLSAYRVLMPLERIQDIEGLPDCIKSCNPALTSMIMGGDRRVIMGPGRGGKLYGIVALVPDGKLHEDTAGDSWVMPGSKEQLKAAYPGFAPWLLDVFDAAPDSEIGLWQLRDLDPLPTWVKGRTIIIGDAAHAMLPTQGQGASQSMEDAEALAAFLADIDERPGKSKVQDALRKVWEARFERVSFIQAYSRQQARPATEKGSNHVTLNPGEFMKYNCEYDGAIDWVRKQKKST